MEDQFIIVDKIKWHISSSSNGRRVQPLCLTHNLRLRPVDDKYSTIYDGIDESRTLKCEDCEKSYSIPRNYSSERRYILDRIDAKKFKLMRFINLDDEALPLAEDKKSHENNKFFVTSLLTKSKTGLRLVVYAGEKGKNEKTQIFVEPGIKRLAFDQKDLHPTDVFVKLEATFADGTVAIMKKEE